MSTSIRKGLDHALELADSRGLEKLMEIPIVLREIAEELERRLARETELHEASYVAALQLRTLDACTGLLLESASSALRDRVNLMKLAMEQPDD